MKDKDKERTNPAGILFANRKVIPYLRQIGVTDQQIRMINIENPRCLFSESAGLVANGE